MGRTVPLSALAVSVWELARPYGWSTWYAVNARDETYLSVGPDVIEHSSNTTQALIKVVSLLERVRDGLDRLVAFWQGRVVAHLTFKTLSYSFIWACCIFSVAST